MVHALQKKANCPFFVETRDYKQDKTAKKPEQCCFVLSVSGMAMMLVHLHLVGHHAFVLALYGITKKMVRFLIERGSDGW